MDKPRPYIRGREGGDKPRPYIRGREGGDKPRPYIRGREGGGQPSTDPTTRGKPPAIGSGGFARR